MKYPLRTCANAGFTLVELAIVLAILGLLAGGILGGQAMIRSSTLNKVGRELQQYSGAVAQFHSRFKALPGDMTNATNYWGTDPDGCPTHVNRIGKSETCNGNGDRIITIPEAFRAWQHLANAGLVDGEFTGVAGVSGVNHMAPGNNIPKGPIAKSGYGLVSSSLFPTLLAAPAIPEPILFFGTETTTLNNAAAVTAEDMLKLDSKLDDGKPASGTILSVNNTTAPNCVTTDTALAEYSIPTSVIGCAVYLLIPGI